ncbi:FecR domain-containing protein [Microvirga sp. SRT01]|uniref:FecR domain-containing protein n=1 Tax=Sphingomonas longa TaxID=2778730 RepID=A0ABS2D8I6_9SPHN|nr:MULTISPECIES: FecR domain-containing protein [Alphaproteobacteria]MBM6577213.1 FecR domain-containing protein [Sphingomonas sp. BT552]MBR7710257.1 FecR domain-containing protein [Microvirga sp. SRT01]
MNDDSTPLDDEAFGWALRMEGPDADWDAFTLWLEHDASRSERYDRAVAALHDFTADVAALSPVTVPASDLIAANDDMPARRYTRRWIGGALAAVLAGAIGLGVWTETPRPYAVETAPGEQRIVALADGSSIVLAGGSKVRLDHNAPRVAMVERGEMLFRIRHDAAHPFAVGVGDLTLVDLGTVFDVKTDAQRTRVSVAEGAVMIDPDGAALPLDPGQAVVAEGDSLRRLAVEPGDVGAWQEGRLAFDGVPLDEVAADLSRQLGQPVRAAPAVARRTFRGTLDVQALKRRPALLGQLLDVTVRQDADGWTLEPHP